MPESIHADAGYGSQKKYEYIEENQIDGYVKYNHFHKEQQQAKKGKDDLRDVGKLHHDRESDTHYCHRSGRDHQEGDGQR